MVFVPFTAIDHHKRSVNVGGALLAHENIESYTWLLNAFLKAHRTAPRLVLSDQDPAMKQAIANVFTDSTHRLCMWHIMTKMRNKVSPDLTTHSEFKKKINKLVWNVFIGPDEFEAGWNQLMVDYKLTNHTWLQKKFEQRHSWIPAYFKDIQNCCLMKTTSRSKSSNSFFNTFARHGNLLVNFMMNFDTALEKQRHDQRTLDDKTCNTYPNLLTNHDVETHAARIYTREVFREVQKEIHKASASCYQKNVTESDEVEHCTIVCKDTKSGTRSEHTVSASYFH